VDGILVNRVLPLEVTDAYFQEWRASQARVLDEIDAYFAPVPVKRIPLFTHEVLGRERLEELARALYATARIRGHRPHEAPYTFAKCDGHYEVRLKLPFAAKGEVGLFKKGDELVSRSARCAGTSDCRPPWPGFPQPREIGK